MSRTLFENSKAALAFAGITLLCAVSMVGTSDNDGMLPKLADRFGAKSAAVEQPTSAPPEAERERRAVDQAGNQPPSSWYDAPQQAPVFGNFSDGDSAVDNAPDPIGAQAASPGSPVTQPPGSTTKSGGGPMTAPLSPTAQIVN